jgi:hypothetical protein
MERVASFQKARSMLSITRVSTGPFLDSSFRPSCSWSAVKIEGPVESGGAASVAVQWIAPW